VVIPKAGRGQGIATPPGPSVISGVLYRAVGGNA